MPKFKKLILPVIIILAFLTFSYKLAEIPNGVYHDEATTGYNSYSILKTGKDEYGKEFPIAFRFFGSYSPPLYTYLTTIPISFLGLNEFSIRIVSVVAAVLMIWVVYQFLIVTDLINKKIIYPLLLLFILTPWNFFFARVGYEIYLGFFLFSLGSLLLLKGLKDELFLITGLSVLSLSTYASHPQIYSAPLFIIAFLFAFRKILQKKSVFKGLMGATLIQIPHFLLLNTAVFTNKTNLFYLNEILANSQKIPLPEIISIPLSFMFSFFARAVSYLSPYSLFFQSDPDLQRSIPDLSVFYSWMVIPFLIGLLILLKNTKKVFIKFLILLITASILPASLTGDTFSTQRALNLLLPLFIIISLGLSRLSQKIKFSFFLYSFIALVLISIILLWRSYFVLLPAERFKAWQFGYKQLSQFISKNPDKKFIVEQIGDKPSYIELIFFLKTDPKIVQSFVNPSIKDNYYSLKEFDPNYLLSNIETRNINWEQDIYKEQIIIGDLLAVSENQLKEHFLEEVLVIEDPKKNPMIKGFKTNPKIKCQKTYNESPHCKNISGRIQ